jgi:hypothetical protein
MKVQLATEGAPGHAENEDLVFHSDGLVGVLDGVSTTAGVATGCEHGPAWYVRRLAFRLQQFAAPATTTLAAGLAAAIQAVRGEHEGRCDLDHPNTPAATVSLVRATGDQLDYLVLCESHIVLDVAGQVQVITDDRLATAVADIRQAALTGAAAIGTPEHDGQVRQAALVRQRRTNQPGGYWIAAATPEAAYHSVTGQYPLTGPGRVRRAILLTDGASCAVERFGLLDWPGLLDLVTEHGPRELIRRVRAAEIADAAGEHQPRYKRHDDASIALCLFEE